MVPRVVIGAGRPNRLPALVCEYTIKKFCPEVEVIHTWHIPFIPGYDNTRHRDRWLGETQWIPTKHPTGTMFSFCRVMVPEICGFEGEAIYFDADQIVFDTVEKIWEIPMDDAWYLKLVSGQYAVLKIDCEGAKEWTIERLLKDSKYRYRDLVNGTYLPKGKLKAKIPNNWNCLDRYTKSTKLLHYTRMPTQPWVKPGHPFGSYWFDYLGQAVKEGVIPFALVEEEVVKQDIRKTWQAAVWPQPHVLDELKKRIL